MNKKLIISLLTLLLFTACNDILVNDISKKQVAIVTPKKGAVVDKKEVTLVWETLEGAETYQVVIVSPSYAEILYYACDSVTEDYKMKVSLPNGTYEWSVQASNSAYVSLKSYETFRVAAP